MKRNRNFELTEKSVTDQEREIVRKFIYPLFKSGIRELRDLRKAISRFFNEDTRSIFFMRMTRAIEVPCTHLTEGGKPLPGAKGTVKLYKKSKLLVTLDETQPYVRASVLSDTGDTVFRLSKPEFNFICENAERIGNGW